MWESKALATVFSSTYEKHKVTQRKDLEQSGTLNALDSLLRPINHGRQRPQSTLLFAASKRDQWVPAVIPTLKPSSAAYYEKLLRIHSLPAFGSRQLREIIRVEAQSFLVEKGRTGLSGSTVHGTRTALSRVLQTAVDWGYLEQKPVRGIVLGSRTPIEEKLYLSPTQVRTLLNSLLKPTRTLVLLATLTGLRIGQLLALRWKHIDLLHGSIHVRGTLSEGRIGTPKTRSSRRDLPLSKPACDALAAHRRSYDGDSPDDLVFVTRQLTPLNSKNLMRRILRPACVTLMLPPVTWHSFRHTHATLLGEVGESVKTAQALLGHSDVETTRNTYMHANPESLRRAVDGVAAILFPNVPKFEEKKESQRVN